MQEVSMLKQIPLCFKGVKSGTVKLLDLAAQRRGTVMYLLAVLWALSNNYLIF
jgi:hypothetical protein